MRGIFCKLLGQRTPIFKFSFAVDGIKFANADCYGAWKISVGFAGERVILPPKLYKEVKP